MRHVIGALFGVTCTALGLLGSGSATATESPAAASTLAAATSTVPGIAVGAGDGDVDWAKVAASGAKFAYVQATQGTSYTNPYFQQQYIGSARNGLLHGAVHFALPDASSGPAQADYLVSHGGSWTADGTTLPPTLDIEYNPYGATCYGLSQAAMATWIQGFVTEVHAKTTRWPVVYTTANWWSQCTGDKLGLAATDPLWTSPGALPHDWSTATFVSTLDSGDAVTFEGTEAQLRALAAGTSG